MKFGPDLCEIKFVRGHDQELVDQLVKNLDGRGTILKARKMALKRSPFKK